MDQLVSFWTNLTPFSLKVTINDLNPVTGPPPLASHRHCTRLGRWYSAKVDPPDCRLASLHAGKYKEKTKDVKLQSLLLILGRLVPPGVQQRWPSKMEFFLGEAPLDSRGW